MELKLGAMTNKELAEWFGITEGGFRNQKQKKLEELRKFADFEIKKSKIEIKTIYNPVYSKSFAKNYEKVKDKIDEAWGDGDSNLDTCARVSQKIEEELQLPLKHSTLYDYTCKGKRELYGVPFKEGGSVGKCRTLWCKVEENEDGEEKFVRLSREEEKIKTELFNVYFCKDAERELIIPELVKEGIITKEEGYDYFIELRGYSPENFKNFKKDLEERLGSKIMRVTEIERFNKPLLEGAF